MAAIPVKVVFVDVDGVLNSRATWQALNAGNGCHGAGDKAICPEMCSRLNRLTRDSGAVIVVSSSWRFDSVTRTRELLTKRGITGKIIGCTPRLNAMAGGVWVSRVRGDEIQAWLEAYHRPIEACVIIDDEDDMAHLSEHLVRTDYTIGLTDANVESALALLAAPAECTTLHTIRRSDEHRM